MSDMPSAADSKGSSAPSEAGVRNNLHGIVFWVMSFMVIAIVAAIIGIRVYSYTQGRQTQQGTRESATPSK